MATAELTIEKEQRQARLASAVRGLRTKAGTSDQAKVLLILGGILIPLGFVLILLGWNGASGTVNVWEQIPYSISGGMLGLAAVFAGGFCYFAYWLTQLVYAARRDAADTHAILERIEQLLAATNANVVTSAAPASSSRSKPLLADGGVQFVATQSGTMYHRVDCPSVAGRDKLRKVKGTEKGLTPCRICNPD